ncbi:hypothetical protein SDC9_116153 [bioreactor metagenome]|uniref:Uncharacterized protein n=1 Tax=bioreactor metagenome TaxID=1076179 RepID=A0A645BUU9_9ZZZZ
MDQLLKIIEVVGQLGFGHLGGIVMTEGVVADFMALGDDVINQGRIGQTIQEEGGFDIQSGQVRQYFAEIVCVRSIADGKGNDFFACRYLIDQL